MYQGGRHFENFPYQHKNLYFSVDCHLKIIRNLETSKTSLQNLKIFHKNLSKSKDLSKSFYRSLEI